MKITYLSNDPMHDRPDPSDYKNDTQHPYAGTLPYFDTLYCTDIVHFCSST